MKENINKETSLQAESHQFWAILLSGMHEVRSAANFARFSIFPNRKLTALWMKINKIRVERKVTCLCDLGLFLYIY